ncbi:uncharacterized protein FFNC_15546 [Fusarium fujikuroi]|nr:uncharacterized protein FFNC_15546 [Fusarium fujikuroi]
MASIIALSFGLTD